MPIKVLKQPRAVFGLGPANDPSARKALDDYVERVTQTVLTCPWDKTVLEMLDLLPQVFLRLGDKIDLPLDALTVLLKHPYVVLQAYERDNSKDLEELLMMSPEYSYHVLVRLQKAQRQPFALLGDFLEKMLPDPFWSLQWNQLRPDQTFLSEIREYTWKTRDTNPRSAWVLHRSGAAKKSRREAVEDVQRLLPLLTQDPFLAFWVAENYAEVDQRPLFRSALRYPPYLLVWAEFRPGPFDSFIQRELERHAAWMIEYIDIFRPSNARELWRNAREKCTNEWLAPWLDVYAQRLGWS